MGGQRGAVHEEGPWPGPREVGRNWVNIVLAGDRPVPVDSRSLIKVSRIDCVAKTYQAAIAHRQWGLVKTSSLGVCSFRQRVLGVDNEIWALSVVINLLLFVVKTHLNVFVFNRVARPGW